MFGPDSVAEVALNLNFRDIPPELWPRFSINGWWLAGTRRVEKGRVVLLGEVGICAVGLMGPN